MNELKIDKRSREYRNSQKAATPAFSESQEPTEELSLDALDQIEPIKEEVIIQEPKNNYMTEEAVYEAPKVKRIRTKVFIKPFTAIGEARQDKMGLDEQKEALFPGTYQIDRIGLIMRNGFKTYITGLDEQVAEVQTLPTEKKLAKIRAIREVVAYLENTVANNYEITAGSCMDNYGTPQDDFWKKVTTFSSTGPDKFDAKGNRIPTYWDKVELQLDNDGKELDLKDPHDLVYLHAIEAGGLSMVAPSLQQAMDSGKYNFYLDQPEETAAIKTSVMKLKFKAAGQLDMMYTNDHTKLFLMAKMVAPTGSALYRRGGPSYTPNDQLYEDIGNYIEGKLGDDPRVAIARFLEFSAYPNDELMRRVVIKDATQIHLIEPKGDGNLYYTSKGVMLGKTIDDVVEYLKNPLNSEIWLSLRDKVEYEWAV